MRDLSLAETLIVKEAMEKTMATSGRTVRHYQADNRRFSDRGFVDYICTKDQKITFCGVDDHHKNGIVENKN